MRTRSVWVIPTALLAGITLALPATTIAAHAAPSKVHAAKVTKVLSRRASSVTLPTGDHVRVTGTATKPVVAVQPAATSGPGRTMITRHSKSDVYVLPAVAEPYVGRFLDPTLFDVTRLTSALTSNGRLPVRISYHGSTPTVPGVTITSTSGGVARGYFTPKSSPAFGQALTAQWKADSKAGWPKRTTLFGDVTKVTADIPGVGTATPKYPMFTLVIKAVGADGKPLPDGFAAMMNVDDGNKYIGFPEIVDGEARVSVPKGHYTFDVDDFEYNDATGLSTIRVSTVNQYQVTGAGQTVTVDLRKATEKPSVTVPRPTTLTGYQFEWDRSDAAGDGELGDGYLIDSSSTFLVAPSGPATVGTVSVSRGWSLAAPGKNPAYTYDLASITDRIPASLHETYTAAQLATVKASYYSDGGATQGASVRIPFFPTTSFGFGEFLPVTLGTSRNEYVAAHGSGAVWDDSALLNNDSFDDPGFYDAAEKPYHAGKTYSQPWFRGPISAGIPTQGAYGFCSACRTSKEISLGLDPFTDSTADHSGDIFGSEDGLPVARFRWYQNGKLVSDNDDYLGVTAKVPTGKTTYKAILDVDRRLQDPNQSTISQTTLGFSSTAGSGGKVPSNWYCDAENTSSCRVLPILLAKVALPTSLKGTLPAKKVTVTVTVARTQYAAKSAVKSVDLEYRPAGWFWTSVTLKSIGGGKYSGTIDDTGFGGSLVDLQVSATDKGGSSYSQTVLRAYTVAGS